ncbi:hypothetical protein EVAR_62099_1 [Eumeta japonica]|uniref:Secreted protein n=1 Tax=Eumeta variegata TaxID=151549 RepID=A0A4C1Z2H0_EUMVA|nr:hypothetical protein EVAR_62099_1 [Eumeta japonica]
MVGAVAATLCVVGVVCGLRRCRCQLQSSSDPPAPLFPTVNPEIREVRAITERRQSRPLSPSRVILARLFRFTPEHSSKFTDSQETKLDASAEIKRPPSPPPIDFDF